MTDLQQAIRQSSPFLERLARFGFACKGTVYLILGAMGMRTKARFPQGERLVSAENTAT